MNTKRVIQMQDQTKPLFVNQALFQASEIKQIEQQAAKSNDYAMYQLMETAGLESWNTILKYWPEAEQISVICGKGNNAGDGFVLARLAAKAGKIVQVFIVEADTEFKGDALTAFQAMQEQGITPQIFNASALENQHLVVDAILGTGLKGPLRGNFQKVIEDLNKTSDKFNFPVFSIDIPSGLASDTGFAGTTVIKATRTLTFIAMKTGMVTGFARACCGVIDLATLGIDEEFKQLFSASAWIDDADALIANLPKLSNVAHKGDHGHLLLVGGDYGFGGAILMAAMAAARCGAGMLTILTRAAHIAPILTQCPEAMIRSILGAEDPALSKILENVNAVVIGPGLGQEDWGRGLLAAIAKTDLPLLVDADALNILAAQGVGKEQWVLTPHPGEAGRLLGVATAEVQEDRYTAAAAIQKQYSAVTVLKGPGTLIASKNCDTTVCGQGNPGMASAGMGDVLSGVIGSLLAQGLEAGLAARTGVALHARAGDIAAENGPKGLMATDLIEPLRMLVNQ